MMGTKESETTSESNQEECGGRGIKLRNKGIPYPMRSWLTRPIPVVLAFLG